MARITAFFILLLLGVCDSIVAQKSATDNVVVIGNNIGQNELTSRNLRIIFRGEQQYWSNNDRIMIVLPSSKFNNGESIMKYIYDMGSTSVYKYWLSLVFQGRAQAPVFVDNPKSMLDYILANKGAIGVLPSNSVSYPDSLTIRIK